MKRKDSPTSIRRAAWRHKLYEQQLRGRAAGVVLADCWLSYPGLDGQLVRRRVLAELELGPGGEPLIAPMASLARVVEEGAKPETLATAAEELLDELEGELSTAAQPAPPAPPPPTAAWDAS